jgi:hypothetical protein
VKLKNNSKITVMERLVLSSLLLTILKEALVVVKVRAAAAIVVLTYRY